MSTQVLLYKFSYQVEPSKVYHTPLDEHLAFNNIIFSSSLLYLLIHANEYSPFFYSQCGI